ncbi:MAG: shikimate dehydrogenase [Pirellulales bacterium]|nr:shikimate dehydrogenase [Pirellulales bacterium]
MICVSIGRGRHRHMIAEHRHLVEQGAKLVELRLDYIRGQVNLKRLLTDRPGPVVMTCRRKRDGGMYEGSEEDRLLLLRTSIAEGADYVDLEDDVAANIPRFGKTKRIVSLHDFQRTPADLVEIRDRLASCGADIVKIATIAQSPHDNVRALELMQNSPVPTVALCMGDIGTPSRILAARFGAPFTYATFHHERALAPGQLSYQQMTEIYRYESIGAETEVYGVIGDPIGHSLSPVIHNAAFAHLGLNKVYVPFRLPRGEVDNFLAEAPRLGLKGLSVTIPHKETVIKSLTKVDGAVRSVGAANTIVWNGEQVVGYNTDYRAAMDALEEVLSGDSGRPYQNALRGKTALLLGAGGVSRAIAHGLKRREANVIITNHNAARADQLAQRVGCKAIDWNSRYAVNADIIINGTPMGMHPNVDETPYDHRYLKPSVVVFDTVYNPESTLLLKEARARSCRVVTGMDMFVRQAALQFTLFTGQEAPHEVMLNALRRAIAPTRY